MSWALELVPWLLVLGILCSVVGGCFYIYSNAEGALKQTTYIEKRAMTKVADQTIADRSNNVITSDYMGFGTIYSRDGQSLYGPENTSVSEAFKNLIGSAASSSANYIAGAYWENLIPDYHILTGYRNAAEKQKLTLTIKADVQTEMYSFLKENQIDGSVFVMDRDSGQVICMASYSAASNDMNMNRYVTVPGSTMKVITTLLFAMQGVDLTDPSYTFDCNGSYTLQEDGNVIKCSANHGKNLTVIDALGESCNCWFAQAIEKGLDWDQASEDIQTLGFAVNPAQKVTGSLGKLPYRCGEVTISGKSDYTPVFGLIGECQTLVSPIQMTYIAALIAGEGQAAAPILTTEDAAEEGIHISEEALQKTRKIWEEACEKYYPTKGLAESIILAKTGTAEAGKNNAEAKVFLIGCTEKYAFFIWEDNYRSSDGSTLKINNIEIANKLIEVIQDQGR